MLNRQPAPAAFETDWKHGRPTENKVVQRMAQQFCVEHGLTPVTYGAYVHPSYMTQGKVADAYDLLPTVDTSAVCKLAWSEFGRQIAAQWKFAKDHGMTFKPWVRDGQPYTTSAELCADVSRGQLFYTLSESLDMDRLLALHDLFGHAAGGYGFGPKGEYNTWLVHKGMFDERALGAMTTRYRGQNAWTHFGAHLYDADGRYLNVPSVERPDPIMKWALLPEWTWGK